MKEKVTSLIQMAVKKAEESIIKDLVEGVVNPWCEIGIGKTGLMTVRVEKYSLVVEIGGDDIERHPNLEKFALNSMKSYEELDDMAIEELGGYDYLMKECYNEY